MQVVLIAVWAVHTVVRGVHIAAEAVRIAIGSVHIAIGSVRAAAGSVRIAVQVVWKAVGGVHIAIGGVLDVEGAVRSAAEGVRMAVAGIPVVIQIIRFAVRAVRLASGSVRAALGRAQERPRTVLVGFFPACCANGAWDALVAFPSLGLKPNTVRLGCLLCRGGARPLPGGGKPRPYITAQSEQHWVETPGSMPAPLSGLSAQDQDVCVRVVSTPRVPTRAGAPPTQAGLAPTRAGAPPTAAAVTPN